MNSASRLALTALLLVPMLAACSDKRIGGCPQVAYIRDLSVVNDYGRDDPQPDNLVSKGTFKGLEGACSYDEHGINVDFKVAMKAERGPRLGSGQASFPFFIAIIKPDANVLSKEVMTAAFSFEDKAKTASFSQDVHVYIPLGEKEDGANYRVLGGFQLTETQLKQARIERDGGAE